MDSSTLIFVATLVVAFIFLRWLISPVPEPNEAQLAGETEASERRAAANAASRASGQAARRRPVTESMIEVVQMIGPSLSREQIILDLNRSGSVELTVERFMETGTLPPAPTSSSTPVAVPVSQKTPNTMSSRNLLERYQIDVTLLDDVEENPSTPDTTATAKSTAKPNSNTDFTTDLHRRKQEMILAARKRLATSLSNEVPL